MKYWQKDNPTVEDKFNLYLSLTAGALDLGRILNPSFKQTPTGKLLDKLYKPLSAVDTFKNGISFMLKAHQCYIQHDAIEGTVNLFKSIYNLAEGGLALTNLMLKAMYLEPIEILGLSSLGAALGYYALIQAFLDLIYVQVIETQQHKIVCRYANNSLSTWFESPQRISEKDTQTVVPQEMNELMWSEIPEDASNTAQTSPIEWNWLGIKKLLTSDISAPNPLNILLDKYHFIAWANLKKNDDNLMNDLLQRGFPLEDVAGLTGKSAEEVEHEYELSSTNMIQEFSRKGKETIRDISSISIIMSKYKLT
jgi:hypothetical protein